MIRPDGWYHCIRRNYDHLFGYLGNGEWIWGLNVGVAANKAKDIWVKQVHPWDMLTVEQKISYTQKNDEHFKVGKWDLYRFYSNGSIWNELNENVEECYPVIPVSRKKSSRFNLFEDEESPAEVPTQKADNPISTGIFAEEGTVAWAMYQLCNGKNIGRKTEYCVIQAKRNNHGNGIVLTEQDLTATDWYIVEESKD